MGKPSWVSNAKTDIGTVRKVNEDDFFSSPQSQLWCVADGMGGHSKGDVASGLIVSELSRRFSSSLCSVEKNDIVRCINDVNLQLWELSQSNKSIVGSTVTILNVDEHKIHCLWAGDSRIYRLRDQRLTRLTRDHSQVEDMVDAGLITIEEAENHPKANVITRAVGATSHIELEHKIYDLLPNDQFLLCSDGLNKVISDNELEFFLIHDEVDKISSNLIDMALSRDAKDNVTCISIHNENAQDDAIHQILSLDHTLPLNHKF